MTDLQEMIQEAERQVGLRRQRAERSGATLEDELRLQCARNYLLVLENKALERRLKAQSKAQGGQNGTQMARPTRLSAKERAALAFDAITKEGA